MWYYKLLAHRPHLILLFTGTLCVACIVVSLTTKQILDFSDPTLGFEARGTELGQRISAWHNLLEDTSPSGGKLIANPYEYFDEADDDHFGGGWGDTSRRRGKKKKPRKHNNAQRHRNHKKNKGGNKGAKNKASLVLTEKIQVMKAANDRAAGKMVNALPGGDSDEAGAASATGWMDNNGTRRGGEGEEAAWEYGRNVSFIDDDDDEAVNRSIQAKKENWMKLTRMEPPPFQTDVRTSSDGFFCESPNNGYSHFVMERINHNLTTTLFEINGLLAMCDLEQRIITTADYDAFCVRDLMTNECCRPWSIPNYVALLANRTHCFDLIADDVRYVQNLLTTCFPFYHDLRLDSDCVNFRCRNVPAECTQFNAVYNIFHFLADNQFMSVNETTIFLRQAVVFVPLAKSTKILPFYHSLPATTSLRNELIGVPAMDLGLKNALFDECLISDGWLVLLSGLFVVVCMIFYTSSVFITAMTLVAIVFSLGVSYFIYKFIFKLTFFPFMNILAVIVIIGIGADDAFIFIKLWQCALSEKAKSNGFSAHTTHSPPMTPPPPQPPKAATLIRTASPPTTFCGQFWRRFMRSERRTIIRGSTNSHRFASTSSFSSDSCEPDTLSGLMAYTVRHSGLSMLVTSLTTAAAFYASIFSSITAVRCFGIFAGTTVLINYVLMMTWLPASVSLAERLPCSLVSSKWLYGQRLHKSFKAARELAERTESFLIRLIMCVPWLWIGLFGVVGILSGVIVFYWPGLQLPESPDFKLFVSSHPFEVYETQYKSRFWFEKSFASMDSFQLPLRFVWGVRPVDKGDYLNPGSRGSLELDNKFNMSLPASQQFLLNFCRDIRKQPFYQGSSFGGIMSNCFIEKFYEFMGRRCFDRMADLDRSPCCENSTRPYAAHIFDECLPHSISSLYATPREMFIPGVAGPKFRQIVDNNNNDFIQPTSNTTTTTTTSSTITVVPSEPLNPRSHGPPLVAAVIIEFESVQSNTKAFGEVHDFVAQVERWLAEQLQSAPESMRGAFFVSELDFFDLQHTLSQGTWIAICVSMAIALVVLFLVTFNLLVSLFAILAVTLTICTTVAVLVLLGWELNVLESVAVSTAIGLAVDFSLHYGVHYQMAPEQTRGEATRFALSRMMGPTIMAALTTAAAGAFMLPSNVLAYIQIGTFLVIVMTTSWLYSTFFLMSVLYVMGPQHGFGQFRWPTGWCCWWRRGRARGANRNGSGGGGGLQEKGVHKVILETSGVSTNNAVSEQLLSASSSAAGEMGGCGGGSESHELDSLTSSSVVKAPSQRECSRPINFDRAFKKRGGGGGAAAVVPIEPSPTTSATMVLPDEVD